MDLCPCGSNQEYASCCGPFHAGKAKPQTALDLMKARYAAFAKGELDFVFNTHHPSTIHEIDREETRVWALESTWNGLEISEVREGGAKDDKGFVRFKAHYNFRGQDQVHSELAEFERYEGEWKFLNGHLPKGTTLRREDPKTGRNDPCPCGSGKKYKKCCG